MYGSNTKVQISVQPGACSGSSASKFESREMETFARPVDYAGIMDSRERSLLHQIGGTGQSISRTSRDADFPD